MEDNFKVILLGLDQEKLEKLCMKLNESKPVEVILHTELQSFLQICIEQRPDMIGISLSYPHSSITRFPKVFRMALGIPIITFAEDDLVATRKLLSETESAYKINGKINPTNLWTKIVNYQKQQEKDDEEKKGIGSSDKDSKNNTVILKGSGKNKEDSRSKDDKKNLLNSIISQFDDELDKKAKKKLNIVKSGKATEFKQTETNHINTVDMKGLGESEEEDPLLSTDKTKLTKKAKETNNSSSSSSSSSNKNSSTTNNSFNSKGTKPNHLTDEPENKNKNNNQGDQGEDSEKSKLSDSDSLNNIGKSKKSELNTGSSSAKNRESQLDQTKDKINLNSFNKSNNQNTISNNKSKMAENQSGELINKDNPSERNKSDKKDKKNLSKVGESSKKSNDSLSAESDDNPNSRSSENKASEQDDKSSEQQNPQSLSGSTHDEKKSFGETKLDKSKSEIEKKSGSTKEKKDDVQGLQQNLLKESCEYALESTFLAKKLDQPRNFDTQSVMVFVVETGTLKGYLMMTNSFNHSVEALTSDDFRTNIIESMKEKGEVIDVAEPVVIDIKLENYREIISPFSEFFIDYEEETGKQHVLSFVEREYVHPKFGESDKEGMFLVDIKSIPPKTIVNFDAFLYLPKNKKFVRYLKEGRSLSLEQAKRHAEVSKNTKFYLPSDNKQKFIQFYIQNTIDWEIAIQKSKKVS